MRAHAKVGKFGGLLLCVVAGLLLFAAPAQARKTHLFLETFGPVEQPKFGDGFSGGAGTLAVDPSNGDLLVIDNFKDTISRFKPNGEPDPFPALGTNVIDGKKGEGGKPCAEEPASCDQTPQNGFSVPQFPGSVDIAIDDSGTLTDGDIYVTDVNEAVNRFADYANIFAADGHYLGQLTAAGGTGFKGICSVAVDPGGNVFLSQFGEFGNENPQIYKFAPSANPPLSSDHTATFTPPEIVCALAAGAGPSTGTLFAGTYNFSGGAQLLRLNAATGTVDAVIDSSHRYDVLSVDPASGHLFGGAQGEGREYTGAGTLLSTFAGWFGIAVDASLDRVYVSAGETVRILGPLVALPDVSTGSYEIKGDTSVRIKGTVNPDGEALEDCHFEYVDAAHYQKFGKNPYEEGGSVPCEAPDAAEVGSGKAPVTVHADLSGLEGEAAYHYRLVSFNHNVALYPNDPTTTVKGEDQVFKTPSKPGIKELWAQDVVMADATLKATLNPENSPTTYRFEYGDQGPCDANPCARVPALPAPEPSLGSDGADHTVGFKLSGLEPSTTYHYRLVAVNGIGTSESADRHFRTFALPAPSGAECENQASRIGPGVLLPDCRAYEMVSPVDKAGGDIRVLDNNHGIPTVLEQASLAGEKLAYGSIRSFGDAASAPFTSQYIAQRIEGQEWQTHSINPPRGRPILSVLAQFGKNEFSAFSPDLCDVWQTTYAEPPLAAGGLPGYQNLYRRRDGLCADDGEAHYEALAPIAEPASIPPGLKPPGDPNFFVTLLDVSTDGEQAVFLANDKLLPEGSEWNSQLYEHARGEGLRFVCILPGGEPVASSCTAGSADVSGFLGPQIGRISSDGSRIFWSAPGTGEGKLYLRENAEAPESAHAHGAATGKGNLIGPATGTGNVVAGSELVKNVKTESGGFAVGQEISSANGGIPANTTIKACSPDCTAPTELTLSAKVSAGKTKFGDALTGAASATIPGIVTETGAFEAGQEISGAAIPPGATVLSCSPSCGPSATSLTLSAKATKTKAGAALSATSPCTEAATKACTIAVSQGGEEASGTSRSSWFWGAALDGSKAIFSTSEDEKGISDLYEFDVDSEATTPIAEGVDGVMGISEDANRVYFASKEVLSGEEANSNGDKAVAGKPNLYLREAGGGTQFIATLAGLDLGRAILSGRAISHTARVSPDGAHAAFVSVAPLTGYDNITADGAACGGSGKPCEEIYRYDAQANELSCASCNPSGARPAGPSSIPPWEVSEIHAARLLADDGSRLYFESADALAPRDTNGRVDIYQWEAPGAGPPGAECTEALPTYSPQDEGCIDLISSGQSHIESRFVESDPSGDDVFFATASSLLPQDPGGVDIYDARVNGGLPIPAGPPPSCEGEACQSPPAPPDDPTPASSAFEGAGNVVEPTSARCRKGKVRRKGRCVAKQRKRAKRHQARGANRNRRARR